MSRRTPASYDEILRSTVPNPDLSFRPSREEEALSRHRFGEATEHRPHPLTFDESDLRRRVLDALRSGDMFDLAGVEVEVDGRHVILSGTCAGPATKVRIEEVVQDIEGVDAVDNQLCVRSPRA